MKNRIFIRKINWLDEESQEADVEFICDSKIYHAFAHPCKMQADIDILVDIEVLESDISIESILNGNTLCEKKLQETSQRWSYEAYGQILSIKPLIVDCGALKIEITPYFRDINLIGQYIYFHIARLDVC